MDNEREQQSTQAAAREEKRAQFTEPAGGGGRAKLVVLGLALAAVAAYAVFAILGGSGRPVASAEVKPAAGAQESEVRVPLKDLAGGQAVFFERKLASGKPVRFFVVRAEDNTYRAALDACEVCSHAGKGYEQKGKDVICRNCGRHFAITDIGPHNADGCNPVPLAQAVEGDHLVIKTSELEKGAAYF